MTTKNIVQVTDQNFETTVSTSSQLVLVDFWATWCAPCKMLRPVIEELATEYEGRIVVGELDVDANPITASPRMRHAVWPGATPSAGSSATAYERSPDSLDRRPLPRDTVKRSEGRRARNRGG